MEILGVKLGDHIGVQLQRGDVDTQRVVKGMLPGSDGGFTSEPPALGLPAPRAGEFVPNVAPSDAEAYLRRIADIGNVVPRQVKTADQQRQESRELTKLPADRGPQLCCPGVVPPDKDIHHVEDAEGLAPHHSGPSYMANKAFKILAG